MSLQSVPERAPSLSTVFPRARGERPAPPQRAQSPLPQRANARGASRRQILLGLTGTFTNPTPLGGSPEPAGDRDALLRLMNRITFGYSLEEYQRASALGYDAYLEEQLDPLAIDDSAMDARLADYTTLALSPKELYETYSGGFTQPYYEFKGAALLRAVHSKRQLFERMVEFWNDHFSIDQNKSDLEWAFLPEHDRDVIRAHALGSFPAMLSACAHGAAMLFYLDNWLNVRNGPQANYARELLELHSLGVHGGYNEFDVTEVARCFTGWTLNDDPSSPDYLRGRFDPDLHAGGHKLVLGHTIRGTPLAYGNGTSTGRSEAQQVVDIVAEHPSTAEFLARKLIKRFLTPTPPQSLVDQVASTYLATNGDIKAMLRVILARENMLWTSPVFGRKFRRPFHLMVSLLRTFQANVRDPLAEVLFYLPGMGHMPFDHVQPDGYPDTVEAWGTSLLPRWDFAAVMLKAASGVSHAIDGVIMPTYPALKQKLGFQSEADRPGLAARMNTRLFGSMLPPREEAILQAYIDAYTVPFDIHALFDCMTLAASLPGFQWY